MLIVSRCFIDDHYYLHYEFCVITIQNIRFLYFHTDFIATGDFTLLWHWKCTIAV